MDKYSVNITLTAQKDINDTIAYIRDELKNPSSAAKLKDKLKEYIFSLAKFPYRHELAKDKAIAQKGIRKILVDDYIVFYIIEEQEHQVTVIRMLYNRRDWESLV